jgi:hypothetical protein
MSDVPTTCPKCAAKLMVSRMAGAQLIKTNYECGSQHLQDHNGIQPIDHFGQSDRCRIAELTAENERLQDHNEMLKQACTETLVIVHECYEATGHIRVAETSTQAIRLARLIAGIKIEEQSNGTK